jgi:hypothetical protein
MMAYVAQAKDTELIGYAAEIRYRASLHPPRPSRARGGAAVTRQGVDMSSHQSVTVTDLPVANVERFQTRLASLGPLNFGPRSSRPVDSREGGLPGAWRARRAHMVGLRRRKQIAMVAIATDLTASPQLAKILNPAGA